MIEKLDKELEKNINVLYPILKNFVEFTLKYNQNCDADTILFNEYDQRCVERCLSIIEDVKNNLNGK